MGVIAQHQLQYPYSWTHVPPDDPRIVGHPDSTFLNRHEGYEVLHFLNSVCDSLAGAMKAERMIRIGLPGTVRSRGNVFRWLQANWHLYV